MFDKVINWVASNISRGDAHTLPNIGTLQSRPTSSNQSTSNNHHVSHTIRPGAQNTQFVNAANAAFTNMTKLSISFPLEHVSGAKERSEFIRSAPGISHPNRLRANGIYPVDYYGHPGQHDNFATGSDGRLRRHPNTGYASRERILATGESVWLDFDHDVICDASKKAIVEDFAGFHLDPQSRIQSFRVGNETIPPTELRHQEVYSLGDGKWMAPQNSGQLSDSVCACRWMLRLEGEAVATQLSSEDLLTEAKILSGDAQGVLEQLHEEFKTGKKPCIIEYSDGEGRHCVIDAIERDGDKWLITMRDPYHASYLKMRVSSDEFLPDRARQPTKSSSVNVKVHFPLTQAQRENLVQRQVLTSKTAEELANEVMMLRKQLEQSQSARWH
ncbi:hypothetical protein [Paraburkholderia sediminicola]|uniref:hypothetical protein n=1 Tax=Paraburkholderia sediminicola TaxID=458836 RepID=UPI0038BCE0B3